MYPPPILNLPQLKGVSDDQGGPTWEYSGYIRGRNDHRAHGYGECVYSDGQSYKGVRALRGADVVVCVVCVLTVAQVNTGTICSTAKAGTATQTARCTKANTAAA
jgi:hypothetical protein